MNDRQQPRVGMLVEHLQQAVVGHVPAPVRWHLDDLGPDAPRDLDGPPSEEAVDADDRRLAGMSVTARD